MDGHDRYGIPPIRALPFYGQINMSRLAILGQNGYVQGIGSGLNLLWHRFQVAGPVAHS